MKEVTSNIELAHRIHEQGHGSGSHPDREEWLEIIEAVVLAAVAVLTAWSGYQAARWDAKSSESYARRPERPWRPRSSTHWPGRRSSTTPRRSIPESRRSSAETKGSLPSSSAGFARNIRSPSPRG